MPPKEKEGDFIGTKGTIVHKFLGADKGHNLVGEFECPLCRQNNIVSYFTTTYTNVRTDKISYCSKHEGIECAKHRDLRKCTTDDFDKMVGKKFGRLTPLSYGERTSRGMMFVCRCDCGNMKTVRYSDLKSGFVRSCGCLAKEARQRVGKMMAANNPTFNAKNLAGQQSGTWTALYRLDKQSKNGTYYWRCVCQNGHYNDILSSNFPRTKTCRQCKNSGTSLGENAIQSILNDLGVSFNKEKEIDGCYYKRPLIFDFYLPDYNCCIEFDGIQHFKPTNFSHDNFKTRKIRDSIKEEFCKENKIALVRFDYTELDKIDKEYFLDKMKQNGILIERNDK